MYRRVTFALALAVFGLVGAATARQGAGEVAVTVSYKGKGTVDPKHEIIVFLFPDAQIGAGSQPLAVKPIVKNGGTATFTGITAPAVYVALAYNEKGDYNGTAGPPPFGTPVHFHADAKGVNQPVKPGPAAKVKLAFDDSRRMK